jgi:hypothetical protein
VHAVKFSYAGYGAYDALFALALVVFALLALAPLVWRRVQAPADAGRRPYWR